MVSCSGGDDPTGPSDDSGWTTLLVVGPGDRIHISANLSSGLGYITGP